MFDVVGVGANSVDHVYRLPAAPEPHGPHSKLRISHHELSPGGQVATTLAACAAMGLGAQYVGVLGDDSNGALMRAHLVERGIDVSAAIVRRAPNPYALILIDDHTGERIVLWDRPGDVLISEDECRLLIERAFAGPTPPRVLHVDDVDPRASLQAARIARAAGAWVTTDLERVTEFTEDLVRTATHPIFGEDLPVALTGEPDLERALKKLREWTNAPIIVTLGADGAMALDDTRIVRAPGVPVRAVDTTGAGDVFRGAFIRGLIDGLPMDRLLHFANVAAAISCTRAGAMKGVPSREEVCSSHLLNG